jgi:hypothetical protein
VQGQRFTREGQMTHVYKDASGLGAGGYDVVGFFRDGRAIPGDQQHQLQWADAVWQFASAEHRDAFAREPERYAPQYGGHCAFAASFGGKAPGSPRAWSLVGGKLYFCANGVVTALWKLIPGRIESAAKKWKE